MKLLILIDGDNIDEIYTPKIVEESCRYVDEGEWCEWHCFGDFVKRKQSWRTAFYEYGVQLHYIPGMDKQKGKPDPNTSDIALTSFAVKKLCENPDLQICIIVANDKDYAPLAKVIMEEFHKKAIMFYTQQSDKAISCYNEAVLLKSENLYNLNTESDNKAIPVNPSEEATEKLIGLVYTANVLVELFKNSTTVLLSELGPILKDKRIKYGRSLGKYLEDMFNQFPILKQRYILKLGDKKDRIERIDK